MSAVSDLRRLRLLGLLHGRGGGRHHLRRGTDADLGLRAAAAVDQCLNGLNGSTLGEPN